MGWQDAPIVGDAPTSGGSSWKSAPIVPSPANRITSDNWLSFAADDIQKQQDYRREAGITGLTEDQQTAIQDAYRVAAGLEPVNLDALTRFYQTRQARTESDPFANFEANFANTMLGFAGGVAQLGARAADLAGITDGASRRFAGEQAEMGRILAPQGGASGFLGRTAGNLANVGLLGGLAGGAAPAATLGGRLLQQLPIAGGFGVSAAGSTIADVEQRRAEGQDISGGQEFLAATGNAVAETVFEMFGQEALQSAGRALATQLPAIAASIRVGRPEGAGKLIASLLAAAGQGGAEELATQVTQNLVNRFAYAPETGLFEGAGEAALQGAIMPLAGGAISAATQSFRKGRTETPTVQPTGELEPFEAFRYNESLPVVRPLEGGPLATTKPLAPTPIIPTDRGGVHPGPTETSPRVLTTFPPEGSIPAESIIDLIQHAPTPNQTAERIISAAMRTRDGQVYRGTVHAEAYQAAQQAGAKNLHTATEGFITSTGRFVGREEAQGLASQAGQLRPAAPARSELMAENLEQIADESPPPAMTVDDAAKQFPTPKQAADAPISKVEPAVTPASPADPASGFFADETGSVNFGVLGRIASGIARTVSRMTNSIVGSMTHAVAHNPTGKVLRQDIIDIESKAETLYGQVVSPAMVAYKQLTRADKQWMVARSEGWGNFQRIAEDTPLGVLDAPNERIAAYAKAYANMVDATGLEAERIGMEIITPDGKTALFRRAEGGRYLRAWTPEALQALHDGQGPLFDAIAAKLADAENMKLRQAKDFLRQEYGPNIVRKVGSLERLRRFKYLPLTVDMGGTEVAIQETDPLRALMSAARQQASKIYFSETFGQNIGDRVTRLDEMRAAFVKEGGNRRDFDNLIRSYEHRHLGIARFFHDPRNPVKRAIWMLDHLLMSMQTSLVAVVQPAQTLMQVPRYAGWMKYAIAVKNALAHPRATTAQLTAIGAMNDTIRDWMIRPGYTPEDAARIIGEIAAKGTGAEMMMQLNDRITGDAFRQLADSWRLHGFRGNDVAAAKDLGLSQGEIDDTKAGKMSRLTYNKIVQQGIQITQFTHRARTRKSLLQNIPLLNGLFAYNSFLTGQAQQAVRLGRGAGEAVRSKDPARMAGAGVQVLNFLAGHLGAGVATQILWRAVRGIPLKREDEDVAGWLTKAAWEVGVLGPVQRVHDAFDYSGSSTEKALVNLSPKLAAFSQLLDVLRGSGRWGEFSPFERAKEFLERQTPAARALHRQWNRFLYPQVPLYNKVRSMAGAYKPRETKVSDTPIKPHAYRVHQAILLDREEGIQEALKEYREWATEQGWDDAEATRRLRSSLSSRGPVNLNPADYREFLASLSPEKRALAEMAQAHYMDAVDALTLPAETQAARRGDIEPLREAVAEGRIGRATALSTLRAAQRTPLQRQVAGVSFADAMRIWKAGSPEDRDSIREIMVAKARGAIRQTPAKAQIIAQQLREAGILR